MPLNHAPVKHHVVSLVVLVSWLLFLRVNASVALELRDLEKWFRLFGKFGLG